MQLKKGKLSVLNQAQKKLKPRSLLFVRSSRGGHCWTSCIIGLRYMFHLRRLFSKAARIVFICVSWLVWVRQRSAFAAAR